MKTITIDFTKTPAEISDRILGYQGEHNRTELIITPPAEMAEDPNIISYAVAFQVGAYEVAHSEICDKADTITVLIKREVSQINVTSLQLEGYDGEETLLIKSERIMDLIFEPSAMGKEYEGGSEPALTEQVASLKKAVENGSGSGKSFKTIRLTNTPIIAFETMLGNGLELALNTAEIKVGAEIRTIRFLCDEKMIDIRNLMEVDQTPYILNMGTVYISPINQIPILAMITKVFTDNGTLQESFIFSKLINYEISEIEIDYYE